MYFPSFIITMEIYDTVAWVAIGFIPTLLAMETVYRLARSFKLRRSKESSGLVVGLRG
jgi:hypothetical protein